MYSKKLFGALKTQSIPANCLRKGDIVLIADSVVILDDVTHQIEGDKESITLKADVCSYHIPAHLFGAESKWTEFRIIVRESLLPEPKPVRRHRRR